MVNIIITILDKLIPEYAGNLLNQLLMLSVCFGIVFGLFFLIKKIWRGLTK